MSGLVDLDTGARLDGPISPVLAGVLQASGEAFAFTNGMWHLVLETRVATLRERGVRVRRVSLT